MVNSVLNTIHSHCYQIVPYNNKNLENAFITKIVESILLISAQKYVEPNNDLLAYSEAKSITQKLLMEGVFNVISLISESPMMLFDSPLENSEARDIVIAMLAIRIIVTAAGAERKNSSKLFFEAAVIGSSLAKITPMPQKLEEFINLLPILAQWNRVINATNLSLHALKLDQNGYKKAAAITLLIGFIQMYSLRFVDPLYLGTHR